MAMIILGEILRLSWVCIARNVNHIIGYSGRNCLKLFTFYTAPGHKLHYTHDFLLVVKLVVSLTVFKKADRLTHIKPLIQRFSENKGFHKHVDSAGQSTTEAKANVFV